MGSVLATAPVWPAISNSIVIRCCRANWSTSRIVVSWKSARSRAGRARAHTNVTEDIALDRMVRVLAPRTLAQVGGGVFIDKHRMNVGR